MLVVPSLIELGMVKFAAPVEVTVTYVLKVGFPDRISTHQQ